MPSPGPFRAGRPGGPAGTGGDTLTVVRVVFAVPLHRTFSYVLPGGPGAPPAPGSRVLAPFGNRRAIGVVVGSNEGDGLPEGVAPRELEAVLDAEPVLPPDLWSLAGWIARYYVAPLGLVLRSMLPGRLLRPGPAAAAPDPSSAAPDRSTVAPDRSAAGLQPALVPRIRTFVEPLVTAVPPALERTARARARVLALLLEQGVPVAAAELAREARAGRAALRGLERAGFVRFVDRAIPGSGGEAAAPRGEVGHPLSADQAVALDRMLAAAPWRTPRGNGSAAHGKESPLAESPRPVLLHGVTGSGKTLVYVRLVDDALAAGGSAVVLVPEIGLTPRAAARFREAFGDRVALLHSALSEGERWDAWLAMRSGEVRVAVGPRSAVFAPLRDLRVVVVDEEHEASYKQEDAPRYHARDVAVVRARTSGALAVLGSATPALESFAGAEAERLDLLKLPRRIAGRGLPEVEVVDLRGRPATERVLSAPLREALAATLKRGEQALLLVNRRGFASFVQCDECGAVRGCPNCRITLTLHRPRPGRGEPFLLCHYCEHKEAAPDVCALCGGLDLAGQGLGTQQVEEQVAALLPAARVARMDHDTTSRKGAHGRIVEGMERGELDVLVGTQMVAKGHDFPGLTLVGVVSADTGLNFPDFRAAERTFQLVAQVAGRSGRGSARGRVLVQTYLPEHPAIRAAADHDYEAFYRAEVQARFEAGYPPALRLARCLLTGGDEDRVEHAARALAGAVLELTRSRELGERLTAVGPSPAPLAQLRGRFRWHVLLKSTSPRLLERVLQRLATRWHPPRGVRLALDRDPYNMM